MRPEQAIEQRLAEAADLFRVATVTAVGASTLDLSVRGTTKAGVPRLASWSPVVGDYVLVAITPAGWIALGKIA